MGKKKKKKTVLILRDRVGLNNIGEIKTYSIINLTIHFFVGKNIRLVSRLVVILASLNGIMRT